MTGPTSVALVRSWLKLPPDSNDETYALAVDAVNAWAHRPPLALTVPEDDVYDADVVLGCTMLAARYERRRNTPSGTDTFGEAGVLYAPRRDPDVDQLLRLGRHAPPVWR